MLDPGDPSVQWSYHTLEYGSSSCDAPRGNTDVGAARFVKKVDSTVHVRPLFRTGTGFVSDVFGVRRHRHRAAEEQRSRPRTLLRAVGEPLFQVRRAKCTREPLSHSYIFCSVFRSFPPCRLTASTSHSFSALLGRSHCLGTCLDTLRAARTSVASLPPYQRMQIRQKTAVFRLTGDCV